MDTYIRRLFFLLLFGVANLFGRAATPSPAQKASESEPRPAAATQPDILPYISNAWQTLGRSMNECSSIMDPKFASGAQAVLYVPMGVALPASVGRLGGECGVRVERLPERITHLGEVSPRRLHAPGLLYLPNRYVVPGGRFNEMYGWDSYFIIRGLLEDGERDPARGIIENFFYEIENYGAVLNANRTYYLTRSQPPFLTSMIMAQYAADKAAGLEDLRWLRRAYQYAERDHALWTHEPKLAGETGLARYFDVGEGPVPDIADHPEYYADVADWLVRHPEVKTGYLAATLGEGLGPELRVPLCGKDPCSDSRPVPFTADYYKGDRAMRESGFDISFRFGPFGGSTHHYAPVCLNSLLYKEETDLARMAELLDRAPAARQWRAAAARRQQLIDRYLWNAAKGMFFDYDFSTQKQSSYDYATAFYPLWAGLATPGEAKATMRNLALFEQPGGLAMSDRVTGVQWDKPYGWAPVTMLAVEGMRRYGFTSDADRVSNEFLSTVLDNFRRDGTIREKYNMVTRTTEANVTAGYQTNMVGFGWTNGAFLVLLHALPAEDRKAVLEGQSPAPVSGPERDAAGAVAADPGIVASLRSSLAAPEAGARVAALNWIARDPRAQDDSLTQPIFAALKDADSGVRNAALGNMGWIYDRHLSDDTGRRAFASIERAFQPVPVSGASEVDRSVRQVVVDLLRGGSESSTYSVQGAGSATNPLAANPRIQSLIASFLENGQSTLRPQLLAVVSSSAALQTVPAIVDGVGACLADDDLAVRSNAADLLVEINRTGGAAERKKVRPLLESALREGDPNVQLRISRALGVPVPPPRAAPAVLSLTGEKVSAAGVPFDFNYFTAFVQPLFVKKYRNDACVDCHTPQTNASGAFRVLAPGPGGRYSLEQSRVNFVSMLGVTDREKPERSKLLLKPLDPRTQEGDLRGLEHDGGVFWADQYDSDFELVRNWLRGAKLETPPSQQLDFAYFVKQVEPVFSTPGPDGVACINCHSTHAILHLLSPETREGKFSVEQLVNNYQSAHRVIDEAAPANSFIVRKPTSPREGEPGGVPHAGGVRWPARAESWQYKALITWLGMHNLAGSSQPVAKNVAPGT